MRWGSLVTSPTACASSTRARSSKKVPRNISSPTRNRPRRGGSSIGSSRQAGCEPPPNDRQRTTPDMRGSRGLWLTFALAIAAALIVVPIGVARSRANASTRASPGPSVAAATPGWRTYTPDDGSFQVTGPEQVHSSTLTTGIGPARRVEFGDGTLSVTWLDAPGFGSDAQALEAGKSSLLRPLVGRMADEEVDLLDNGHPGFGLLITIE